MSVIAKEVTLRRALLADAGAIATVRIECWRTALTGLVPDRYVQGMQLDDATRQWQRVLAVGSVHVFVLVAECEGNIVGFASAMMLPEPRMGAQVELSGWAVLPAFQGVGIGAQLLRKLARMLQQNRVRSMLCWVLEKNQPARDALAALGAREAAQQEFEWDETVLLEIGYVFPDLEVLSEAPTPSLH